MCGFQPDLAFGLPKSFHRGLGVADVGYDIIAALGIGTLPDKEQISLQNFRAHAVALHPKHEVGTLCEGPIKNNMVLHVLDSLDRQPRADLAQDRQPYLPSDLSPRDNLKPSGRPMAGTS